MYRANLDDNVGELITCIFYIFLTLLQLTFSHCGDNVPLFMSTGMEDTSQD